MGLSSDNNINGFEYGGHIPLRVTSKTVFRIWEFFCTCLYGGSILSSMLPLFFFFFGSFLYHNVVGCF